MNEVEKIGRQEKWTQAQYKAAVDDIISENRQGLRKGKIKLNKNSIRGVAC